MGKNLANEVKNFLQNRSYLDKTKISFLGFSMGGIIIRAALPHLSDYKDRMHTFITLSSPHLGGFE
jgi:triacylglycerol esterase/lipase EstA (alpha/beta hydrolase family)